MIEFSCSTVACPDLPVGEAIRLVESVGFDLIEFRTAVGGPEAFACDPALSAEDKSRAAMQAAGIRCSSVATGLSCDQPIWPPVIGRAMSDQSGSVPAIKRAIDLAAMLESPFVRVFGFQSRGRESVRSTVRRVGWRLRQACDHARHTGVRLLVENGGSFESAESVRELVDAVKNPLLGVSYDASIGRAAGDVPSEAIATLGGALRLTRIRDASGGRPVRLGEGGAEAEGMVRALAEAGVPAPIVYDWDAAWFEDLGPAEDALGWAIAMLCEWTGQTASGRRLTPSEGAVPASA